MTALDLHAAVKARLATLTSMTGYPDGNVPDKPPADASGRVYPYWVMWPTLPGERADDLDLAGEPGPETWDGRVTVAAGDPTWCHQAALAVRDLLQGWTPGPHLGRLTDSGVRVVVSKDPDVMPPRWFAALVFTVNL
jgi:hypothetical protein